MLLISQWLPMTPCAIVPLQASVTPFGLPSLQPVVKPHLLLSYWIQKKLVLAQKIRGEVEEGMKLSELNGLLGVTDLTLSSAWGTIPFFAGKETRVGVWK